VVSHHLDGFLRASAASLLHPAAGLEVRPVSRPLPPDAPERALGVSPDPRDAVHTLRRVPLISSRTASLRPLPSYRYVSTSWPELDATEAAPLPRHQPKPVSATARPLRRVDSRARTQRRPKPPSEQPSSEEAFTRFTHRPRPVKCPSSPPKWPDGFEDSLLCIDDAPIRRSGPPRHRAQQAASRGIRDAGEPASRCFRTMEHPPEGGHPVAPNYFSRSPKLPFETPDKACVTSLNRCCRSRKIPPHFASKQLAPPRYPLPGDEGNAASWSSRFHGFTPLISSF
jgi:hypothetical protein